MFRPLKNLSSGIYKYMKRNDSNKTIKKIFWVADVSALQKLELYKPELDTNNILY